MAPLFVYFKINMTSAKIDFVLVTAVVVLVTSTVLSHKIWWGISTTNKSFLLQILMRI